MVSTECSLVLTNDEYKPDFRRIDTGAAVYKSVYSPFCACELNGDIELTDSLVSNVIITGKFKVQNCILNNVQFMYNAHGHMKDTSLRDCAGTLSMDVESTNVTQSWGPERRPLTIRKEIACCTELKRSGILTYKATRSTPSGEQPMYMQMPYVHHDGIYRYWYSAVDTTNFQYGINSYQEYEGAKEYVMSKRTYEWFHVWEVEMYGNYVETTLRYSTQVYRRTMIADCVRFVRLMGTYSGAHGAYTEVGK